MPTILTASVSRLTDMRVLLALTAIFGLVSAQAGRGTLAFFTDTATVGSNAFTAGTIDIATSPTSALLTASNLAPGDITNGTITVSNSGTLALRYAITGSG